jgi:hypothetical protein
MALFNDEKSNFVMKKKIRTSLQKQVLQSGDNMSRHYVKYVHFLRLHTNKFKGLGI